VKKRHRNDYKNIHDPLPEKREENERKIFFVRKVVDYSVFKKTPEERLKLKIAKAQSKLSE
jgi:hypothetical protein